MASSTGVLVTIEDILKILPPEVLKYFILRSRPSRHLDFDPRGGILELFEEFNDLAKSYEEKKGKISQKELYTSSLIGKKYRREIDFSHLVYILQAANYKFEEIIRLLQRTGHIKNGYSRQFLKEQIERVKIWLENYAPQSYKFSIQKKVTFCLSKIKQKAKRIA